MSNSQSALNPPAQANKPPDRITIISYPKIVFLYPTYIMSFVAAVYFSFLYSGSLDDPSDLARIISAMFLCVFATNLVVLAFDFPRTTSLTIFFLLAFLGTGLVLLFVLKPTWLPVFGDMIRAFSPVANGTFYWFLFVFLSLIYIAVLGSARFDYWEVTPNELLHHHGVLSNLERFPSPHLRVDKEIEDVFEYFLLRSGKLILQPSNERRAIILENVPFIGTKERMLTSMLGALQVQVREEPTNEAEA